MSEGLRILVVDDDRSMANTLVDILQVKGHEAEAARSGSEALDKIRIARKNGAFDCVLTDIKMPEMNGVELYREIKTFQPEVPVVLMTAYTVDTLVAEGLREGAVAALTKPLDVSALLSFLSDLRKERCVVIVDDDAMFRNTLGEILRTKGFAVAQVSAPCDWEQYPNRDSQIVLLDMKLNGISGLEVLAQIREKRPDVPVILVTGYREEMSSAIEMGLKIDAYACLYKPLEIEELFRLLTELRNQDLGRILGRIGRKER